MSYEPNTTLSLSFFNNGLNLDRPTSAFSSSPLSPAVQRTFSYNYCRRKFYSLQALWGHQNAHKLERSQAKKSLELHSPVQHHAGSNQLPESSSSSPSHGQRRNAWFADDVNNGPWTSGSNKSKSGEVDLSQLDLSLRL